MIAKFEKVDINKIIPYARNARTHSKEQILQLRGSIREFGFLNPVMVDKDLNLIAGHGRVEAAKAEGLTEVPCVFVEHLTDAQKRAYILADNRLALNAGWDEEMLAVEISELMGEDFDVSMLGFDSAELDKLMNLDDEVQDDNFDVEEELKKPCFSKTGDVWQLGNHKIICGDSTKTETYQKLLGDTKVNLVCTDSPYGVALESVSGPIKNDDLNDKDLYNLLYEAHKRFYEAMANDASIYSFYATMKARIFYDAFEDAGFRVGAGLIWKKPRAPLMRTDWKFNMEPLAFGWKKKGKHIWYGDQKQKSIFEFDGIKSSKEDGYGHASSKPVPLLAHLITKSTMTNGLVLDGFLGSASTLIACEQLNRICYGIELEPKFIDVAVKRYIEQVGSADNVSVLRDGEVYSYKDVEVKDE